MQLSDEQLGYFDQQVLSLEYTKKQALRQQVKFLVGRLQEKVNSETDMRIVRTYRAGSLKKGTILRPHGDFNVDADVVFYISTRNVDPNQVDQLNQDFKNLLLRIYPQKVAADFTLQPRTIGVQFSKSGLSVDLVPVMDIPDSDGDGWQPSFNGGNPQLTNTPKQLGFIYERHLRDPRYRPLVRLVKGWRNHHIPEYPELEKLGSFLIELLMAHVLDTLGPSESLESGLEHFWNYLLASELREPILCGRRDAANFTDPVVVVDPVNPNNNVAGRITEERRSVILARAEHAWEKLHTAHARPFKGSTLDAWRDIFGRRFRIEEAVA